MHIYKGYIMIVAGILLIVISVVLLVVLSVKHTKKVDRIIDRINGDE
ncbi:MAG: hypothetical protein J5685_06720 [Clostridiales bacterium]|nr:hypothetical protein [Clostridiales bacterium]